MKARWSVLILSVGNIETTVDTVASVGDGGREKPPGKRENLEICNISNDSKDLGKVAAEAAISLAEVLTEVPLNAFH